MKKFLSIALLLWLQSLSSFSQYGSATYSAGNPVKVDQDLTFIVREKFIRPVTQEQLRKATRISELISNYPYNWIHEYLSTEITVISGVKSKTTSGSNEELSPEQKMLLSTAEQDADIEINIFYLYRNPVNSALDKHHLRRIVSVIPQQTQIPARQALFTGGYANMMNYFKASEINSILKNNPKQLEQALVVFTINEQGKISNAKISRSSGDIKTDTLLLETIQKMPAWQAAENSAGLKIKQKFDFFIGVDGC